MALERMKIIDLETGGETAVNQAAAILHEAFADRESEWPDLEAAVKEVRESLQPGRLSRIAVDEDGNVLGWIGGIRQYEGKVWELHPLVVSSAHRGKRVGSTLVTDLSRLVGERGAHTLWLGTDDDIDQTSLSGVDLYPDVLSQLARIRNRNRHPFEFYLKQGFVIVGVMPDANGPGKPDIYMARRVGEPWKNQP